MAGDTDGSDTLVTTHEVRPIHAIKVIAQCPPRAHLAESIRITVQIQYDCAPTSVLAIPRWIY